MAEPLTDLEEYENLLDSLEFSCTDRMPIIRVNPADGRETFTEEELKDLKQRDFKTRVFFSEDSIDRNNAWIRTHHSDVGIRAHIDYCKEYFEAAYAMENHTAAKATLTGIMETIFTMDKREYYNFATVLASALSHEAQNTFFEFNYNKPPENVVKGSILIKPDNVSIARRRFVLLMNIIFRKISTKRFLETNGNIFRLVHCRTKYSRHKDTMIYAFFSFLLQSVLGVFVIAEVLTNQQGEVDRELRIGLYALASLGSLFGLFTTLPDIYNFWTVYDIYGKIGPLYMIDVVVNVVIPLFLVVVGFIIVSRQSDYINGVIMTTALLFIPEIDDQLPQLLGFQVESLIESFVISEAKVAFDEYLKLTDEDIDKMFEGKLKYVDMEDGKSVKKTTTTTGIDFSDVFVTNSVSEGSDSHDFAQPFSIKAGKDGEGHELDPSNFITEDCLVKTIEWRYINTNAISPGVGYLRLTKLDGTMLEIDFSSISDVERGETCRLDGVYMITNFVTASQQIESLRLAGSERAECFIPALEHYSLWDISNPAKRLIKKSIIGQT